MFNHTINPFILNLGALKIKYYGLFYVIAFLFGIWWFRKYANKFDKDEVYDLFLYLIIGGVGGGRLGYVIFYNLSYYISNPLKILAVNEGGMSIHGGLIGASIAIYLFIKKMKKKGKEISYYYVADNLMIPLAFSLALGRIGNFINGELAGKPSNVWWCFNFPGYDECRHPSQLYESAKNIFIGIIMYIMWKKENLKEGTLMWTFVFLYGILRFLIEFIRGENQFLYWLTKGQILSVFMIVIGAFMIIKLYTSKVEEKLKIK